MDSRTPLDGLEVWVRMLQIDLDRLVKLLGMLGSHGDGEVLIAAKKANELVRSGGCSWEEIILNVNTNAKEIKVKFIAIDRALYRIPPHDREQFFFMRERFFCRKMDPSDFYKLDYFYELYGSSPPIGPWQFQY